jgi:tetratricopeptide (TPR) repeat protein
VRSFAPLPLLLLMGFSALAATVWLKPGDLTALVQPWRDYFGGRASADPKAVAYVKSGDALLTQGDYDDAIAEYTKALAIDANYTEAQEDRANVYFYQGYYDLAIADYDQIILLRPRYVEVYFRRAVAYYNKGDYERAIAGYDEVIRLNPRFGPAYTSRRLAYANRSNSTPPSPITFAQPASFGPTSTPATAVLSPATERAAANEPRNEPWPTTMRQSGWGQSTPWHSTPAVSAPRTAAASAPRAIVSQSGSIRRQH